MADGERCIFCRGYVPEGRQVCPQCEIELRSKPDTEATLGIEEETDENSIIEDWIKFYKAYPVEFCELCGLRLTFIQKIALRTIVFYERIKNRRNLK